MLEQYFFFLINPVLARSTASASSNRLTASIGLSTYSRFESSWKQAKEQRIGPYSRALARGVIGTSIDGRSREGRYLLALEKDLLGQLGGEVTVSEKLLVTRAARAALRLELLDEKLAAGKEEFTPTDGHTYSALSNSLRLSLTALGLKPKGPRAKTPTLSEIASRYAGGAA